MVQLQVKRPRALLFDISGTVAKTSFIDKVLFPYITNYAETYFNENWDNDTTRQDLDALRAVSQSDPEAPQIASGLSRDEEIDATVKFIRFYMEHQKECKALTLFRFRMWFDGYKRDRLNTPVYSDVAIQLQHWRSDQGIKLFVVSNGWSEATKRFLQKTSHGDMNLLIENHFDTRIGKLNEPDTYRKILEKIKEEANEVLFLTKDGSEGNAALNAGLNVVLVLTHRRNIEKLNEDEKKIPRVRSFNEIDFV
ncbi:hypothetical protein RDWZM_002579 [Blomia tropicalis]|uniref:Enolase-phosphatase E1 n=1 Tax=Blomia tropicalis TaxID=40697 RepID=A0A9Q0RRP6_BLOTA|nr:Enolase-phosphatase E1 [Blomia tropicalis]KAJ6224034.1 hypothetical protein RDWZM_002579 [Blomia tropicalis]